MGGGLWKNAVNWLTCPHLTGARGSTVGFDGRVVVVAVIRLQGYSKLEQPGLSRSQVRAPHTIYVSYEKDKSTSGPRKVLSSNATLQLLWLT